MFNNTWCNTCSIKNRLAPYFASSKPYLSRLPTARFRSGQGGKGASKRHPKPPKMHPKTPKRVPKDPKMDPKGTHGDQGTPPKEALRKALKVTKLALNF